MNATAKQAAKAGKTISHTAESAANSAKQSARKQMRAVIKPIIKRGRRQGAIGAVLIEAALGAVAIRLYPSVKNFWQKRQNQTVDLNDAGQTRRPASPVSPYGPADGPVTAEHEASFSGS